MQWKTSSDVLDLYKCNGKLVAHALDLCKCKKQCFQLNIELSYLKQTVSELFAGFTRIHLCWSLSLIRQ